MPVVSDLRQYTYCPRIIYYQYCLPQIRPVTYKMVAGNTAQESEEQREQRRSLRVYGLQDGERHFNLEVESARYDLRGRVDLAIKRADEAIPIEYKDSPGRVGQHIYLQLTAYGMLLEELWQIPARRGFIYFIPTRRVREVALTAELQAQVVAALTEINVIISTEHMPAPPAQRGKCEICEFRRFCNDVV